MIPQRVGGGGLKIIVIVIALTAVIFTCVLESCITGKLTYNEQGDFSLFYTHKSFNTSWYKT